MDLEAQVTLLPSGALGLRYFPDEGTSLIQQTPLRLVLTSAVSTYLVEADDMMRLSAGKATQILSPGAAGSFDNGYVGISAIARIEGTYYGFYHAEDQEDLPSLGGGIPGYYASIGLATSTDGVGWQKRGQVITSSQPKSWQAYAKQGDRGAAEPGAVLSKDGRYLYLYYTEHSRVGGRSVDICLARAELKGGPPAPGGFKKYLNGGFTESGLGGRDSPVVTAKKFRAADALEGHVTYSRALDRYLMVFGVDAYQERMSGAPPKTSGLYLAWSSDAIAWSLPVRLIADQAIPQTGRSLSWEASLVWTDDAHQSGWLIYGYTPRWGGTPHYLVGRRVALRLSGK